MRQKRTDLRESRWTLEGPTWCGRMPHILFLPEGSWAMVQCLMQEGEALPQAWFPLGSFVPSHVFVEPALGVGSGDRLTWAGLRI